MRFAKLTLTKPEPQRQAGVELIRRIVGGAPQPTPRPEPAGGTSELPLDQRVRLVGEW